MTGPIFQAICAAEGGKEPLCCVVPVVSTHARWIVISPWIEGVLIDSSFFNRPARTFSVSRPLVPSKANGPMRQTLREGAESLQSLVRVARKVGGIWKACRQARILEDLT